MATSMDQRTKRMARATVLVVGLCLLALFFFWSEEDSLSPELTEPRSEQSEKAGLAAIPRRMERSRENKTAIRASQVNKAPSISKSKSRPSGVVLDTQGNPVAKAMVGVFPIKDKTPEHHATFKTTTDDTGRFHIPKGQMATSQSYAIIARKGTWRPATYLTASGEQLQSLELRLSLASTIEGRITGAGIGIKNRPITSDLRFGTAGLFGCGEEMFWLNGRAENKHARASTGSDGYFVLEGLAEDLHLLHISDSHIMMPPGMSRNFQRRVMAPSENVEFNLDFSTLVIHGDAGGLNLHQASVEIRNLNTNTRARHSLGGNNKLKAFVFANAPLEITITHPQFEKWTERVVAFGIGQTLEVNAELKSETSASLVLQIIGPNSFKLKHLELKLTPASQVGLSEDQNAHFIRRSDSKIRTMSFYAARDSDGRYRISVPLKDELAFQLEIKSRHQTEESRYFLFDRIDVRFVPFEEYLAESDFFVGGLITLKLRSRQGDLEGVKIKVIDNRENSVVERKIRRLRKPQVVKLGPTSFTMNPPPSFLLPPGTHKLTVQAQGHKTNTATVKVEQRKSVSIDMQLEEGGPPQLRTRRTTSPQPIR